MTDTLDLWHLLTSPRFTGAAEPALTLCRDLAARGHRVVFFADRKREGDLLRRAVEDFGVRCGDGPTLSAKASPLEMVHDLRWLARRFRGPDGPDLVHCHHTNDHLLCRLAARGSEGPLIVRHLHGGGAVAPGWTRRWLWRGTAGAVTADPGMEAEVRRRHGMAAERVLLLSDTVDARRFTPDGPGRVEVRRRLGLTEDTPLLGLVARFRPGRGHDRLVRVFRHVRQLVPGAHLALVGRGEERAAVEALVRLLELERAVHFPGYFADDLPELYRSLDAAVLLREGSDAGCRGVLEAMASGLPVVGTDRAAMPRLIADGETGYIVEDGDEQALARVLARLLGDRSRCRSMGRAARTRVERRFGPEARAERCERFYLQLLAR